MSALHTASGGLRSSLQMMSKAATGVQQSAAAMGDVANISETAAALARGDAEAPPELARSMVDMRIARYAATANLQVIRTIDEMSKETMEIGGDRR